MYIKHCDLVYRILIEIKEQVESAYCLKVMRTASQHRVMLIHSFYFFYYLAVSWACKFLLVSVVACLSGELLLSCKHLLPMVSAHGTGQDMCIDCPYVLFFM